MLDTLSNTPRDYSWGSRTLIPTLQGRAATGALEAEIWFGDHPGSPATLGDGRPLAQARADAGEPPLPYLLKVLAARSSLSIQAHPDRQQARAGYEREEAAGIPIDAPERVYRDDNHKPEIIVAISDRFRALVGLRMLPETLRLLGELGNRPGVMRLRDALSAGTNTDALRQVITDALSGASANIVADLSAALSETEQSTFPEELDVLRAIAQDFPGDPGIIVAVLMNLVVLRSGEAVFAPAGVLHAYQGGLGVELMAASDNVLRGGLTPKHIDVDELMRIVDTRPGHASILRPRSEGAAEVFDPGVPDFVLTKIQLEDVESAYNAEAPTIIIAVEGTPNIEASGVQIVLRPGHAAYATKESSLQLRGPGVVYLAQPRGDS